MRTTSTLVGIILFGVWSGIWANESAAQTQDGIPKVDTTKQVSLPAPLTLNECVRLALENAGNLRSAQYDLQIAELVKKDAGNIYWPRIRGGVDYVIDDGSVFEDADRNQLRPFLSIGQMELNSVDQYTKLRDSVAQLTKARISLLQAKRQLIASVADRFFTVFLNQKQAALNERDLATGQRHLHDLQLKLQDGLVSQIEFLQAEIALNTTELQLQKSKNALQHSIMALALSVGLPAESRLSIAEIDFQESLEITWEQCRDIGLENNETLKIYQVSAEEMQRLHASASRTRWPSLSAEAYLGENPPQGLNSDANIGATITLSQKLFDAGETKRRISRAAIEMEQHQLLAQRYQQTFINGLRLLYDQFVSSKEELTLASQKHQLAVRLYDLTERSYELGSISLEEKRKAQETIRHSEIMFSRANVQYLASEIELKIEMSIDPWRDIVKALNNESAGIK